MEENPLARLLAELDFKIGKIMLGFDGISIDVPKNTTRVKIPGDDTMYLYMECDSVVHGGAVICTKEQFKSLDLGKAVVRGDEVVSLGVVLCKKDDLEFFPPEEWKDN